VRHIKRGTPNRKPGPCTRCGETVQIGQGRLTRTADNKAFAVMHHYGETVYPSGPWDKFEPFYRGGCPRDRKAWEEGQRKHKETAQ